MNTIAPPLPAPSLTAIRSRSLSLLTALLLLLTSAAPTQAADADDYLRQIKPLFAERCLACHGALKQNAGLRLDTAALAIKGGKHGPAIKPGNAADSALMERVTSTDELDRMPPEGEPLKPAEIALIRAWIAAGAKAPADEVPERDPKEHWAFKPPVRPALPQLAAGTRETWTKNPIDAFIAAGHQQHGLTAQPAADKRIWLRRVTIDLTGLPPTLAEMSEFLADHSDDAFEKVVDRLLASPQHGERWGRHWMDIWRYSDWWGLGAEVRNSQKHMWHWRDWIIESVSADKPYDQMLREMLAADELYPTDTGRLRAGGFLARQYFLFNRTSWLDETVEHTAKAMLGLTFNCAKCHDHKYDPISHVDYYQLRAFFEPYQIRTDFVAGELDPEKNGIPRPFDCNHEAVTHLHRRGDDRDPDTSRALSPGVPAILSRGEIKIAPIDLPAEAHQPGLRPFVLDTHLKQAQDRIDQATVAVEVAGKALADSEAIVKRASAAAAAGIRETGKPADGPVDPAAKADDAQAKAKLLVLEDFTTARPEIWETRGGMWSHEGGKLVQSQTGATRAALRLKKQPPADFEATLKYIPTGGDMWKSIGIAFDVGNDGHMVTAYLSSYAGGPKSQITFKRNGGDVYPPEAAQNRKVDLNQTHEITLRVRGKQLNVLIDGELSLAYQLPIERKPGHLELSTFDAKARFVAFELRELPADVAMVESITKAAAKAGPMSVDEAKLALLLSEKALATAKAQLASITARAAAMQSKHQQPAPHDPEALAAPIAQAVRSERLVAAAKADEEVTRAELELMRAAPAKKTEAGQKVDGVKAAFEKARDNIDTPGGDFTPLAGALKTRESNVESDESRRKPFPATSTGRRTALAHWITDANNPLTARVAVNHIWSRHMGRPLVATVFDFGRKGAAPTHPELLDWLAVELIESGWSMKHIHRLIVTSQAYRLSSSSANADPRTLATDGDNRFHWRTNPVRMEAQVVRDSLLHLAGELDLAQGGPSIPVNNDASRRRSIYFFHSKNEQQRFLSIFDDANVLDCYRRSESIVPQQALALENSPLALSMAQKIAGRINAMNPGTTDGQFVNAAFLLVLCSEPSAAEQTAMMEALALFTEAAKRGGKPDPSSHARANLIHALLNHNDFVTVR